MLCRLLVISLFSLAHTRWMIGTGMMTWKRPLAAPLAAPSLIRGSSLNPAASITLGKGQFSVSRYMSGRSQSPAQTYTPKKELGSMVQSNMPQQKKALYLFDSEENMLSRLMKRGNSKGSKYSRIRILWKLEYNRGL